MIYLTLVVRGLYNFLVRLIMLGSEEIHSYCDCFNVFLCVSEQTMVLRKPHKIGVKRQILRYLLLNCHTTLDQTSASLGPTSISKNWMGLDDPNSKASNSMHSFQLFVFQFPH